MLSFHLVVRFFSKIFWIRYEKDLILATEKWYEKSMIFTQKGKNWIVAAVATATKSPFIPKELNNAKGEDIDDSTIVELNGADDDDAADIIWTGSNVIYGVYPFQARPSQAQSEPCSRQW